jgi:hypothetical protein
MDEFSLPPLSIANSSEPQPFQHFIRQTDSIPPIDNDKETERILFNQYNRLQNSLLDSLDNNKKAAQFNISQTNVMLTRTIEEKNDLGVIVYQNRKTIASLNRTVAQSKALFQKELNEKQMIIGGIYIEIIIEFETGEKEIEIALKHNEVNYCIKTEFEKRGCFNFIIRWKLSADN